MNLQSAQIERQFDRAAATYDDVASLQREMADCLLKRIPGMARGTMVDLGCGTGDTLAKLADQTSLELTGVDLSAAMLEHARTKVPTATLLKADLQHLPFEDAAFDWAVSNAALQWCDATTALTEMFRILRPGGRLLLTTFGPATLHQWRDAMSAISDAHDRVHRFPSAENLLKIMQQAGFTEVEFHEQRRDQNFNSVSEMLDSIRKLGATNARRDRAAGLSGRQWLRQLKETLESQRNGSGRLTLTYQCYHYDACRPVI